MNAVAGRRGASWSSFAGEWVKTAGLSVRRCASGISGMAGIPSLSFGFAFMYLGCIIALGVAGRPMGAVGVDVPVVLGVNRIMASGSTDWLRDR